MNEQSFARKVNDYLLSPKNNQFRALIQELFREKIDLDLLKPLCLRPQLYNNCHMGEFFFIRGRLLEANFFFSQYLKQFPNDILIWQRKLYVSAKSGAINSAYDALIKIKAIGSELEYIKSLAMYLMAIGNNESLKRVGQLLMRFDNDRLCAEIIFDIGIITHDWFLVRGALNASNNTVFSRLHAGNEMIMKTILLHRLGEILTTRKNDQ